jgi:hypothetical protein
MSLPVFLGQKSLTKHPVVSFPAMPAKIRALIRQDWDDLDSHGEAMMQD